MNCCEGLGRVAGLIFQESSNDHQQALNIQYQSKKKINFEHFLAFTFVHQSVSVHTIFQTFHSSYGLQRKEFNCHILCCLFCYIQYSVCMHALKPFLVNDDYQHITQTHINSVHDSISLCRMCISDWLCQYHNKT